MGDRTTETLPVRKRLSDEECARRLSSVLELKSLRLDGDSIPWILNHIDCFVNQCRGNKSVAAVHLFPHSVNGHGDDIWKKVAQAIGNLQSLKFLHISTTMAHHESLTDLLRLPSLRSVRFHHFVFTTALCQATANALIEGTAITKLNFLKCSFPAVESAAILANGFSSNTSVSSISVHQCNNVRALYNALASALPSNSSLRHLALGKQKNNGGPDLSQFFLALGNNTGLETLIVHGFGSMDESLCTAINDGLVMNETLESLELNRVHLTDDNSALWCRAFSFLHINKTLKSLLVDVYNGDRESKNVSAFRIDMAASLQENTSLESLTFRECGKDIKTEETIALVTALQRNTTLKTLRLCHCAGRLQLTADEDKQMASLLKTNYALEKLPDIDPENEAGDLGAILRLNEAGRRYLVQDGSSISKGVEVLSKVKNYINCVFLHLLENPRLCDRRAVEMVTAGESNSMSTNPNASSGGGKREQASAHRGKESRMRLA
jgi:hypothetical protein